MPGENDQCVVAGMAEALADDLHQRGFGLDAADGGGIPGLRTPSRGERRRRRLGSPIGQHGEFAAF
jgi:hypothetical protein